MEIIVGKNSGFCYGVKNAVTNTEETLKKYTNVSCLGELVHNADVLSRLEQLGLTVIQNIEEASSNMVIRAHGTSLDTYEKATKLNINLFDFTCPKVLNIHKMASKYAKNNYYIFLIGIKNHPETIGNFSYCGNNSFLIETKQDIKYAIDAFNSSNINKLYILSQTTFNLKLFNSFIEEIKSLIPSDTVVEINNTICNATRLRQEETLELSKEVDCMIIVGGKNSSNTKKLYDVSIENCKKTFLIENKNDLDLEEINGSKKIGLMAGASTPDYVINDVIKLLKKAE